MSYENTAGINVDNQYGPFNAGGTQGVLKTRGYREEFTINFDAEMISVLFPVGEGCWVTGVDETFSTTAVSAYTVGGVDILAATEAAPVELAASNTGIIVITGPTAGTVVTEYKSVQG